MSEGRGSLWRKWDLHVHTPYSVYQCFGPDTEETWENYITDLENLPSEFAVIGINDYLFLNGYERLKYEQNINGRLPNRKLLPVVEFRIDKFAGVEFGSFKRINLHVIFSDEVSIETIRDQFLNTLHQSYVLGNGQKWERTVTIESLEELGKKIIESSPEDERGKFGTELIEGFNNLNISEEQIINSLKKDCFENKYLIAVGKTEWAALRWSDSSIATKKTIINSADLIFTAANSVDEFYKGKEQLSANGVNDLLLDCSDAHYLSNSSDKDRIGNCSTWIKADPTFEGLKQALIEPSERIFIGDEPEILSRVKTHKTKYIENLSIDKISSYSNGYGQWFQGVSINLNKELVAIIGNKGSGKSAIADIISLCGNFKNHNSFSFLNKNKFRKGGLSKNFEAGIKWENGTLDKRFLNDEPQPEQPLKIKYLPQGDFENLTNEIEKAEKFQEEIEHVVFSHLRPEERSHYQNFDELIADKKTAVEKEIKSLEHELEIKYKEIISLETKLNPNYIAQIEGILKQKEEELKSLIPPIEILNPNLNFDANEKNATALAKIENLKSEIERIRKEIDQKIGVKSKNVTELDQLKKLKLEIDLVIKDLEAINSVNSEFLVAQGIDLKTILKVEYSPKALNDLIQSKETIISQINFDIDDNPFREKKNSLIDQLEDLNSELKNIQNTLDTPLKNYQKYLKDKEIWENQKKEIEGSNEIPNSKKFFENELNFIRQHLETQLSQKYNELLTIVGTIFNSKEKIIEIYKTTKQRIDYKIAENQDLLTDYNINIEASLVLNPNFRKSFINHIQSRKLGTFNSIELGELQLMKLLDGIDFNEPTIIIDFLNSIIDALKSDKREGYNLKKMFIDDQINNLEEFFKFLFSLDYLDYNYNLKLGNRTIEQLSPGERGALLLVFYLLLDNNDTPLILDQPEDNLDNHSVANVLVPFIRRAKKRRQIILVTHNPNLAVVADAEQVIWVDILKTNNEFIYKSGSIENREINECIVNVLEGAMPAFNKRKQKYYE